MKDIAAFQSGYWNGQYYDPAFVRKLHDNFQKYCTGSSPYYRPFVSINHIDHFRFGQLTDSRLKGNTLHLDADDVPVDVIGWVKAKMLSEPSVEFIEPQRDAKGNLVSGFTDRAGRIENGPVIKCLTFLGNDLPGVKGLPPLPAATFRMFHGGFLRKFGSRIMDRSQMLQFLTEQNFDVSGITDVVPDEVLKAIVAFIQAKNTNPPSDVNTPPTPPVTMADAIAGLSGATNPAGTAASGAGVPSQVVVKFNQQYPGLVPALLGSLQGTLSTIQTNAAAVNAAQLNQLNAIRNDRIKTFFDKTGAEGTGQVTPAMQPAVRRTLEKCDLVKVSKFSHDPKKSGTEFDAACDEILATYPVVREFKHKTTQPPVKPPAVRGDGAGGGAIDPERRRRMLGGSPVGQTVLAADKD